MERSSNLWLACKIALGALLLLFLANVLRADSGCPHAGSDRRLLGRAGCWVQRKLTLENRQTPTTIWSLHLSRFSLRVDPKHPHLLLEWPASSRKLWCFRAGYRWDANAKAYIFPAIAFKKLNGPMKEYQVQHNTARITSGATITPVSSTTGFTAPSPGQNPADVSYSIPSP